jgi:hypothetical protein
MIPDRFTFLVVFLGIVSRTCVPGISAEPSGPPTPTSNGGTIRVGSVFGAAAARHRMYLVCCNESMDDDGESP